MSDAPNDWKENRSAAQQIDENENIPPSWMFQASFFALFDDDFGNVRQHLKRYHNHEDLLIFVAQDVLDESPSSSDENNRDEQNRALQQMCNVVENCPGFDVFAFDLDEMIVNGMKHQAERLQEHQDSHKIVNFKDGMLAASQNIYPEESRQEEQQGHHKVKHRQWHLGGW